MERIQFTSMNVIRTGSTSLWRIQRKIEHNANAPVERLRTQFILNYLRYVESLLTCGVSKESLIENIEHAVRLNYEIASCCYPGANIVSTTATLRSEVLLYIFIQRLMANKRGYKFDVNLQIVFDVMGYLLRSILGQNLHSNVHSCPILKIRNTVRGFLYKTDLRMMVSSIKKRKINYMLLSYPASKLNLSFQKLIEEITKAIRDNPGTRDRFCFRSKHIRNAFYKKGYFTQSPGTEINLIINVGLKLMESFRFARISVGQSFLEFNVKGSETCTRNEFIKYCYRLLSSMKYKMNLDTSTKYIVSLPFVNQIPETKSIKLQDFKKDVSCGCEMIDVAAQVSIGQGRDNLDLLPRDSKGEESSVSCEEEEDIQCERKKFLKHVDSFENLKKGNAEKGNNHHQWNRATIETVASFPSTSAAWDKYCKKMNRLSRRQNQVASIPLKLKIDQNDKKVADNPSNESLSNKCKFYRRREYRSEYINMSRALIEFKESLTNVSDDLFTYSRTLDSEETGYIKFEELIELLSAFSVNVTDSVLQILEEWFSTPKGIDYCRLMEALNIVGENEEEDMEIESSEETDDDTKYIEEKESQDLALHNVMQEYGTITEKALIRLRVSVFESGIPMLDILRGHDLNNTGCFSRQELYNILSPLVSLSHEVWTLVMYRYCRPFDPQVIPYRAFADDVDVNATDPIDILLPLNYINTGSQNPEVRKKLTWVIERIGRTCTLMQIQQLFCGLDDNRDHLLNEDTFQSAVSHMRFLTITEKELLFQSFSATVDSMLFFDFERLWKCCRFIHMTYYMGKTSTQES